MGNLLILNYHEITADKTQRSLSTDGVFKVKKSVFIQHLNQIEAMGIPIVSLADWFTGNIRTELAVSLTFDDGFRSDFETVMPILQDRGIKATFFPVLKNINQENRLTWPEIQALASAGFEIGAHGVSHENICKLRKEPCKLELELSKRLIEQKIGRAVTCFAPPFGAYNRHVLELAFLAGYQHLLSTQIVPNSDEQSFVLHRWNIKANTDARQLEKVLAKNSTTYRKMRLFSWVKNQFPLRFAMAVMQAKLHVLKRING